MTQIAALDHQTKNDESDIPEDMTHYRRPLFSTRPGWYHLLESTLRGCHPDVERELRKVVPRYVPPIQMDPLLAEAIDGASHRRPAPVNLFRALKPPEVDYPPDVQHFANLAAMDGSKIFDLHQETRCPTVQDLRQIHTEPAPNYLSNPNPSLCFHTVVAQCKETQLELPVVAQLDDGATPSLISSAIVAAPGVPLRTR